MKSRVLLGHFIKILKILRTRALLGHLTLTQSSEISRISWPLYNNSYTPKNSCITWPPYLKSDSGNLAYYLGTLEKFLYSYEFAYYLATLLKVRVRKSRASLGHSFQDRLRLTRVLRGHLCIYISHEVH